MSAGDRRTSWIDLKPTGPTKSSRLDRQLVEFGERTAHLLSSEKAKQNHFVLATLDDFLGAIYALILALHNEPTFKYRPKGQRIDPRAVLKRARSIARAHRIRTNGKWMAGFHFNSSLFRLLATYHRSLKIVTGKPHTKEYISTLLPQAKRVYRGWTSRNWTNANIEKVRKEVNDLKHEAAGIFWGRAVKESEATLAAAELLNLLEAWNSQP